MATITTTAAGGNWHDAATWEGGVVPVDTDRVVVVQDATLTLDGVCKCQGGGRSTSNAHSNAALSNRGVINIDTSGNVELHTAGQICNLPYSSGDKCVINFGSESAPIQAGATFKWYINPEGSSASGYVNALYNYYSGSRRPTFTMVSAVARKRNTWLVGAFDAGVDQIVVDNADNWQVGDVLWLVPRYTAARNSRYVYESERAVIQSISGTNITLTAALNNDHGFTVSNDHRAGGVCNMTSNAQIIADDDRPMYRQYHRRANVVYKNVEFQFANNIYRNVSACVYVQDGNRYGLDCVVTGCCFWTDSRNFNVHTRAVLYLSYGYTENDRIVVDGNARVAVAQSGTYRFMSSFCGYYGGRNVKFNDCSVYAGGTRYIDTAFGAYQQPLTLNSCRVYGCTTAFNLHDNVDIDTIDCWSVGCHYGIQTYNGTAIYKDLYFRFCNFLGRFAAEWRGKAKIFRPNFSDEHVYMGSDTYFSYGSPLPDGNSYAVYDVQNDPSRHEVYLTYGTISRDTSIFVTSVAGVRFRPTSGTDPLVFTTSKYLNAGEDVSVSVSVRKNSNYDGGVMPLLRLSSSEFDVITSMSDIDDAWEVLTLVSPAMVSSGFVDVSIEGVNAAAGGRCWFDDLRIDATIFDIGNQVFFGGTEISTAIDITDTNGYLTITGLVHDTEVRLYNADLSVEIFGVENSAGDVEIIYSGTYVDAVMVIHHIDYINQRITVQLTGGTSSLSITQSNDDTYLNP